MKRKDHMYVSPKMVGMTLRNGTVFNPKIQRTHLPRMVMRAEMSGREIGSPSVFSVLQEAIRAYAVLRNATNTFRRYNIEVPDAYTLGLIYNQKVLDAAAYILTYYQTKSEELSDFYKGDFSKALRAVHLNWHSAGTKTQIYRLYTLTPPAVLFNPTNEKVNTSRNRKHAQQAMLEMIAPEHLKKFEDCYAILAAAYAQSGVYYTFLHFYYFYERYNLSDDLVKKIKSVDLHEAELETLGGFIAKLDSLIEAIAAELEKSLSVINMPNNDLYTSHF